MQHQIWRGHGIAFGTFPETADSVDNEVFTKLVAPGRSLFAGKLASEQQSESALHAFQPIWCLDAWASEDTALHTGCNFSNGQVKLWKGVGHHGIDDLALAIHKHIDQGVASPAAMARVALKAAAVVSFERLMRPKHFCRMLDSSFALRRPSDAMNCMRNSRGTRALGWSGLPGSVTSCLATNGASAATGLLDRPTTNT